MKQVFGGLISLILLGIYVHLTGIAVGVAGCVATPGCRDYPPDYFNDGMAQAMSVIGGLVSALVIADLAMTPPGQAPGARAFGGPVRGAAAHAVAAVSVLFVLAWIGTGLTAFLVGMYYPEALPVLTTHGHAWLGLAVSAAYAYFGLSPVGGAAIGPGEGADEGAHEGKAADAAPPAAMPSGQSRADPRGTAPLDERI